MKKYSVVVPIAGAMDIEVEAESRDFAIETAMAMAEELLSSPDGGREQIEVLEPFVRLVEGGVMQVEFDSIEVFDEDGLLVEEGDEDIEEEEEEEEEDSAFLEGGEEDES